MIREVVAGRYEVVRRLGSGGMGSVHLARDRSLGRDVALKVLYEGHAGSREFVERFRREARSAASLSHPNIVAVFDAGEDGSGAPYMAMEYVPGGTLKERIAGRGALTAHEAAGMALQTARALEEAHARRIVHRDIKPENILLTGDGGVKVADFGIARAAEVTAMTQTSQILGTAGYLSPEQARGEPVGPASDLYSLGVVLYEMLCGDVPFRSESPIATAMQHLTRKPAPLRSLDPGIPEALDAITMRLLAKNPQDRYPDAASLREDLERFLDGRPLIASEATASLSAAPRSLRKRRRLALLSVVPLMALAAPVAAELGGAGLLGDVFDGPPDPPVARVTPPALISGESPQAPKVAEQAASVPEVAVVPNLTGMTVAEAEATLSAEGLLLGEVEYAHSASVPEGAVISQDAPPGYEARPGATVNLIASAGPPPVSQREAASPEPEGAPRPSSEPTRAEPEVSGDRLRDGSPGAPEPVRVEIPEIEVPDVEASEAFVSRPRVVDGQGSKDVAARPGQPAGEPQKRGDQR